MIKELFEILDVREVGKVLRVIRKEKEKFEKEYLELKEREVKIKGQFPDPYERSKSQGRDRIIISKGGVT